MDDRDFIFENWPSWLRWILFLPLSVLGMSLFTLLSRISISYLGYSPDAPIAKTMVQYAGIGGFLYVIYTCVPKFKEIITGTTSLILALLEGIVVYLYLINDNWFHWDFFIALVSLVGCAAFGVYMFIEHGKNTAFLHNNSLADINSIDGE